MFLKKIPFLTLLGGLLFLGCGNKAPAQKAPSFTLKDINGVPVSVPDPNGKIVFLEFWATWCGPCRMAAPLVDKLIDDYDAAKVIIISISLDDDEALVKRYAKVKQLKGHVVLAGASGVDSRYGVSGIPAFIILDKNGMAAGAWEGFHPSMYGLWRKKIDGLLNVKN